MKKCWRLSVLIGLLAAGLQLAVAAAFDASSSTIAVVFSQLGVPVEAKFKNFSAQIVFDQANVAATKAQLTLDISSFDMGDVEYNKEVQKKEWFNAAQFPKATFVSSAIQASGAGKLQAAGQLTIKGKTIAVNVPIAFKQEAGKQVFEGSLPIKRLDFNIGEGEWKDTDTLANEVVIKFKIVNKVQ